MSAPHVITCPSCDGTGEQPSCGCQSCAQGPGCSRSDETEPCETCSGEGVLDCESDSCDVCFPEAGAPVLVASA